MKVITLFIALLYANNASADQSSWIDYSNINNVSDVAMTGNIIWSNTTGGLIKWNRTEKTWDRFMPTFGMQYSINTVAVAPNDDVWISAFGELIRYDGVELEIFTSDDVDVVGSIVAINFEPDGDVWIGNKWGYASRYNGETWTEYGEEDGLGSRVYAIAVHPDNSVWFGTWGNGVFCYSNGEFTRFSENEGLVDDRVLSITIDEVGTVWVGTAGGISVISGETITTIMSGWINTISTGPDGTVWAAAEFYINKKTFSNVYRFDGSSMEPFSISDDSLRVNKIVSNPSDGIWFCTDKWLGLMTDEGWEYYQGESELYLNYIMDLETSKDGSVWFGHNRAPGAISRFIDDKWEIYHSVPGNINDIVNCIHEDQDGTIWFGLFLCSYNNGIWTSYEDVTGLGDREINAIDSAPDGSIWVGTASRVGGPLDGSVWRYSDGEWSKMTVDGDLPRNHVLTITVGFDNVIWVGTPFGMSRYDGTNWKVITSTDGFNGYVVSFLTTASNGVIWACTDDGVYYCSNDIWEHYVASDSTVPIDVNVMTFDTEDGIWMGTSTGLLYDDGVSLHKFTTEDGLTNNIITSLDIAQNGSLWIGTLCGVSRYIFRDNTIVEEPIPSNFFLTGNYPNPFNLSTTISYSLPQNSQINLSIYNISGQRVRVLKDECQTAGHYTARWDATGFPSGLYFCIMEANGFVKTRKMVLVK
ncbi:two-component regulator propeller domain-containing protein [Candidatus Latescibacterota bacterium]